MFPLPSSCPVSGPSPPSHRFSSSRFVEISRLRGSQPSRHWRWRWRKFCTEVVPCRRNPPHVRLQRWTRVMVTVRGRRPVNSQPSRRWRVVPSSFEDNNNECSTRKYFLAERQGGGQGAASMAVKVHNHMRLVAQFKIMCHWNNTCGRSNQLAWSSQTTTLSPTIEMGQRYGHHTLSVSLQTRKCAVAANSEAYSGKNGWQMSHVLLRTRHQINAFTSSSDSFSRQNKQSKWYFTFPTIW